MLYEILCFKMIYSFHFQMQSDKKNHFDGVQVACNHHQQ